MLVVMIKRSWSLAAGLVASASQTSKGFASFACFAGPRLSSQPQHQLPITLALFSACRSRSHYGAVSHSLPPTWTCATRSLCLVERVCLFRFTMSGTRLPHHSRPARGLCRIRFGRTSGRMSLFCRFSSHTIAVMHVKRLSYQSMLSLELRLPQ